MWSFLRRWWPQVPLGLALAGLGLWELLRGVKERGLASGSEEILGLGLIFIAAGLSVRLRAAWVFALLLLVVAVGLDLTTGLRGPLLLPPLVLFLALLYAQSAFQRRTLLGSTLISLASILAVLAYGVLGSYLLGSGFNPPIRHFSTALYFSVITLSTVGYGDIVPKSEQARLFVVSLILIGLLVFATAIASTLGPLLSGELAQFLTRGRNRVELRNHVILIGEGSIARNTARELAARQLPYVQLVTEEARVSLPEQPYLIGDPFDEGKLQEAGIQRARMVIAAREDDGENAFIALLVKDLNPKVQVLAVASSARSIHRLKLARADLVLAPGMVGGRLLANLVEGKPIPEEFNDLFER